MEQEKLESKIENPDVEPNFSKLDKSTAVPSLTKTTIGNLALPIPPLPEQHRIVAKIEELFAVLDNIQNSLEA